MSKRTRLGLTFIIAVMLVTLLACGKEAAPKITGKWKVTDSLSKEYVFNDDGTGVINYSDISKEFNYEIKDDKITITTQVLGVDETKEYTYTLTQNELTLNCAIEKMKLERQE